MLKTIALIALLAAFPPLSTDMYLAAIPLLVSDWQQPLAIVNLTLICFFIAYCGFLLVYGPLSDRYGRRPPLLAGLTLYISASLLCTIADNIILLILPGPFREQELLLHRQSPLPSARIFLQGIFANGYLFNSELLLRQHP